MRVLMVVRPAAGGMKEHVIALSSELVHAGHQVEVATPPDSPTADAARQAGLQVHPIALVGPLDPVRDLLAALRLRRIVQAGRFDLVHAHGFKAGLVSRLLSMRSDSARSAIVVTAHNHVLFREDVPGTRKAVYRLAERAVARRADRYIAVSESIRRELVDGYGLPGDSVSVVHNGVDPAPFLVQRDRTAARERLGLPGEAVVVGLAARFSAQKGIAHLVDAVPEMLGLFGADGRQLVVAVGGSGPLEAELRTRAEALGLGGAVRWLGHVESIPEFLATLDVYASPAETEALGIGLIEASLAGLPIVATDVGGVSEVVVEGETGILISPRNSMELARAIHNMLTNPSLARHYGTRAREWCMAQFAPARMLERTLAAYNRAIGDSGTPVSSSTPEASRREPTERIL